MKTEKDITVGSPPLKKAIPKPEAVSPTTEGLFVSESIQTKKGDTWPKN